MKIGPLNLLVKIPHTETRKYVYYKRPSVFFVDEDKQVEDPGLIGGLIGAGLGAAGGLAAGAVGTAGLMAGGALAGGAAGAVIGGKE